MLWDDDEIAVWFFPRDSIPSDLVAEAPQPTTWGTPMARWPASSCSPTKYFYNQSIIFDITLCGDFAGDATVFAETCSGTCTDLVQDPTNYDNAYFEVQYVRVFTG